MEEDGGIRETRRKAKLVVKQLREHQQQVEDDKAEAVDCRSETLREHFKKAERNFGKSQTVDQALIDAQIFHKLGVYSKRQADQLQTGLRTYDVKTFTDNLVVHMRRAQNTRNNEETDDDNAAICFITLGRTMWNRWLSVPTLPFLYGNAPISDENSVRQERKRPRKIKKGTLAVKPSELRSDHIEQTETDRQIADMKRLLKSRPSWNYWVFVLDPDQETGFTRSIENIFHSSFLIKEKVAHLDMKMQPERISYIGSSKRDPPTADGVSNSGEKCSSQVIVGFDRRIWLEKLREHDIRKCYLPSRTRPESSDLHQRNPAEVADANGFGSAEF